jgi:hypothetical protein
VATIVTSVRQANPPVSVLLTTHNREKYVADAIESVLTQRFSDFELLIVDDRSTDRTPEIVNEYALHDKRIRVVINDRNLGQFQNRNHAASLASAPLIKYHDSDDLMYPHCLDAMVPPMLSEPRAAIGISLSKAFSGGPSPMLLTPRLCYQREFLGQGMFMGGPACGIFRREEFLKLGGFPERGVASDSLFWLNACARVNVLTLPGDLFWYRVHPGQEAQSEAAAEDYARLTGEKNGRRWNQRSVHSTMESANGQSELSLQNLQKRSRQTFAPDDSSSLRYATSIPDSHRRTSRNTCVVRAADCFPGRRSPKTEISLFRNSATPDENRSGCRMVLPSKPWRN